MIDFWNWNPVVFMSLMFLLMVAGFMFLFWWFYPGDDRTQAPNYIFTWAVVTFLRKTWDELRRPRYITLYSWGPTGHGTSKWVQSDTPDPGKNSNLNSS